MSDGVFFDKAPGVQTTFGKRKPHNARFLSLALPSVHHSEVTSHRMYHGELASMGCAVSLPSPFLLLLHNAFYEPVAARVHVIATVLLAVVVILLTMLLDEGRIQNPMGCAPSSESHSSGTAVTSVVASFMV
jgi:hypothetical protein